MPKFGSSKAEAKHKRKNVVCIAVDNSQNADETVQFYIDTIHKPGNEVILMHCADPLYIIGEEMPDADTYESLMRGVDEKIAAVRNKYLALLKKNHLADAKFVALPGQKCGPVLVQQALKDNATLVVTGSRSLGTSRKQLMGSVSEFVARNAHCPVLICRECSNP